mmetsp:Transcript_59234/g.156016  ORF Transcript_59234/g.156016 Transcript_59234/m.156016 type:complete len:140 (-) Transcript_59234:98-517(-)
MRRVERLIMGSPAVLRTVTGLTLSGRRDNPVVKDWVARFVPGLRYGNPTLAYDFRPAKVAAAPAAKEGGDEADKSEAAEAPAGEQPGDDSAAPLHATEHIELSFTDGTNHFMNLALYRQSHQVMQRIVELDSEKGISAG